MWSVRSCSQLGDIDRMAHPSQGREARLEGRHLIRPDGRWTLSMGSRKLIILGMCLLLQALHCTSLQEDSGAIK